MAKAKASFAYRPAPGRLIVKSLEITEKTESGLYLPESAKERPQLGKVVAYTVSRRDDGTPIRGRMVRLPEADDVSIPVQTQLIVELCSK